MGRLGPSDRAATSRSIWPQTTHERNRDELDPPFEILEPAEWQGPVVFNSPARGIDYPHEFLAVSRLDSPRCGARRTVSSTSCRRRGPPASLDARAFPALLRRRQPRAL